MAYPWFGGYTGAKCKKGDGVMKKRLCVLSLLVFVLSLLFTGCGNGGTGDGEHLSQGKFKAQMMFNGSSSLSPIIASIASTFTEQYETWDKVNPDFPAENISIFVASGGSGVGIKSVLDGTSDFGMVARTVKDSEKEKISNYQEFVVAADALTVSVNAENPIANIKDSLTTEEIRNIFSGKYKYWDEVDPALSHNEIVVVIRDLSGGAYEVFQKAVMGEMEISPNAVQSPSMGALATKIVENKFAIGYASFGVYNQNIDHLTALKVDGIAPTEENILNGSYPIQRPLLFIKNGDLTATEQAFIDYIYSDVGKKAVVDNGYIPKQS